MNRRGRVFLDDEPVGWIDETESGMEFRYDHAWLVSDSARPVSQTLPLQEESFVSRGLHPYFENLLPEGWLLDIALAELKLARGDALGMLLHLCRDCIGAVWIVPEDSSRAKEHGDA